MSSRSLPSAFQTAREYVESRIITNPLEGDPGHRVLVSRWFCDRQHWGPGRLNDPDRILLRGHPDYPDLYCVIPDRIERQTDSIIWFTRTYASIPRSFEQVSSGIVTVPGFNQAPTFAGAKTITAVSLLDRLGRIRCTSTAHGYSAGDNVHIQLTLQSPPTSGPNFAGGKVAGNLMQTWNQSITLKAISTDTFDIVLPGINENTDIFRTSIITGSVRKITAGFELRPATTRNITTVIIRDYFLPGVSEGIPARSLIPLSQPFKIEQGTTAEADFEDNVLTATTIPTATQYRALIEANALLAIDCVIEEYLGPLVCRKSTMYPAI